MPADSPRSATTVATMDECRITTAGASLYYRRWPPRAGAGAGALVLMHGFASNASRWQHFAEQTALRDHWTLITPDLRGHGRSPWRGRLRSDHWIADLAAILDAEGRDRAVIGGHCLGANTTLRFAERHPERSAGLVLVEPMAAQALGGRLGRLRRLRGLLPWLARPIRALNALGLYRRRLPLLDLDALDRATRAHIAETGDTRALTRRYGSIRHDLHHMPSAAYLQALGEVVRPLPRLAAIEAPALVLLSTGGLFGDPEQTRRIVADLPRARIEQLEAEHWIPTEQPQAMARHIERWLAERP